MKRNSGIEHNFNILKELIEKIDHGYDGLIHCIKVDNSLQSAEVTILVRDPESSDKWIYIVFKINLLKEFRISQAPKMSYVVLSPYGIQVAYYDPYIYIDFAPIEDEPPQQKYTLLSPLYFCCESIEWVIKPYGNISD